jgi:hypothetical protein
VECGDALLLSIFDSRHFHYTLAIPNPLLSD